MSRGVDVLGSVLASLAPFGLLTAGLWAKAAGAGATGMAGARAGAAALGATAHAGSSTAAGTTAAGSAGGIGVAGGVAAAAAVAVVAGASWFGLVRSDAQPGAAPSTTQAAPSGEPGRPERTGPTEPTGRSATTAATVTGTAAPGAATTAPEAEAPTTTAPATSTTRPAPTTSQPPRTSEPPASSTTGVPVPSTEPPDTTTSTSVVTPPAGNGVLTGRVTQVHPKDPAVDLPVSGVDVVAYNDQGRLAAIGTSGGDGRWALDDLAPGHYVVVAVVPATYRWADGPDPWTGGDTWAVMLGSIDVADTPIDLVDLRLIAR